MRMVTAVLVFLLQSAWGASDPELPFCGDAIRRQLDHWARYREWRQSEPGLFISPTVSLGEWLELQPQASEIELRKTSWHAREQYRYRPDFCHPRPARQKRHYSPARLGNAFTDDYLRTLVKHYPAGIVYSWSPHMPLSFERIESIRKAARKLQLPVFYVLDPHADRRLARSAARGAKLDDKSLLRMESFELFQRGMLVHYPSVLVFARGKVRGKLIPGWKHEATYVSWVKERLAE